MEQTTNDNFDEREDRDTNNCYIEQTNGMKIIGLKVDGIRKLSAIEMKFNDSGLIPIVGKNKQGKTSILDSIEMLFTGKRTVPKDVITHGKTRGEINVIVGENGLKNFTFKRVVTEKESRIEIRNKDGYKKDDSPQAFLDSFFNSLTFNPRPFLNKTPAEKQKFMMTLLKLDFTKQDAKIKEFEQERLFVGREVKNMGEIEAGVCVKNVDVEELFEEKKGIEELNNSTRRGYENAKENALKEIVQFNDVQKTKESNLLNANIKITHLKDTRDSIETQIEELKKKLSYVNVEIAYNQTCKKDLPQPEELKPLEVKIDTPEYSNTDHIENQIKEAGEINRKADLYDNYLKKFEEKEMKKQEYKDLSYEIDSIRDEKKKILSEVDIPVSGLEVREDGIYHNDIYSENWSESEGLRISSELCVAMNPKLRAIFIDKGESYDSDSLKDLEQWATKNNLQAFITIVNDIPEEMEAGTFYIEEGEILNKQVEAAIA